MYRTVIVPLDGSSFAAQAVRTAAEIARRTGANLVLARVHESYVYEDMDSSMSEAMSRRDQEEYLADVADDVESTCGIMAQRHLLTGPIVTTLCSFAEQLEQALIVISTHGRTGFSRFWLGSIADAVARHSVAPVLLLRHQGTDNGLATPSHPFKSIVAPLDGSDLSESVLAHVATLAKLFQSRLTLARVVVPVKTPAAVYAVPFAIPQELPEEAMDSRVEGAQGYLNLLATRLQSDNQTLDVRTSVRVADAPAPALLESAEWASADTIALATHGRGSSRLIVPSVADKILRGGLEAILVVHA